MSRNARPADCRVRAGVGDTRVSGASALLAEWASQKPFYGIRTRGSQRPDDSQGRGGHMEQEHGAFKENPPLARRCSDCGQQEGGREAAACSNFIHLRNYDYLLCR